MLMHWTLSCRVRGRASGRLVHTRGRWQLADARESAAHKLDTRERGVLICRKLRQPTNSVGRICTRSSSMTRFALVAAAGNVLCCARVCEHVARQLLGLRCAF